MSEKVPGPEYGLVTFRHRCPTTKEIEDLSSLHAMLLPRSPVVLLGRDFMQRFYYRFLPSEGHIAGAIAYVNAEPTGFISVASHPTGFMRAALRRHWPRICWLVGASVLRAPGRLAAVKEALEVDRGMAGRVHQPDTGELLSFGVLPEYRTGGFIRRTGIRLADDLLAAALVLLRETGVRRVRAVVDTANVEAGLFYRGRGWTPSGNEAHGWSQSTVEFTLDLDSSPGEE